MKSVQNEKEGTANDSGSGKKEGVTAARAVNEPFTVHLRYNHVKEVCRGKN
jgi:hypothetical protein